MFDQTTLCLSGVILVGLVEHAVDVHGAALLLHLVNAKDRVVENQLVGTEPAFLTKEN